MLETNSGFGEAAIIHSCSRLTMNWHASTTLVEFSISAAARLQAYLGPVPSTVQSASGTTEGTARGQRRAAPPPRGAYRSDQIRNIRIADDPGHRVH